MVPHCGGRGKRQIRLAWIEGEAGTRSGWRMGGIGEVISAAENPGTGAAGDMRGVWAWGRVEIRLGVKTRVFMRWDAGPVGWGSGRGLGEAGEGSEVVRAV